MDTKKLVPRILELCVTRTRESLSSQANVRVGEIASDGVFVDRISLRDVTAVIAVGGPLSFLVSFSLDLPVLDIMFRNYTADIEVDEDEVAEYRNETLADIVNLIMGQVTTDLEMAGAILTVSPPIVFEDSRQIHRPKKALFSAALLSTPDGSLNVSVIGPPELFDQRLNEIA